jgi:hypothetical protein
MLIPAIKIIGENTISGIIAIQICVEEQMWHRVSGYAVKKILPGAHDYIASFDCYGYTLGQRFETILRGPFGRALQLIAPGIEPLVEMALR